MPTQPNPSRLSLKNFNAAFNKALFKSMDDTDMGVYSIFLDENDDTILTPLHTWKVRSVYTGGLPISTKRKVDALDARVRQEIINKEVIDIPGEKYTVHRWTVTFRRPVLMKYSVDKKTGMSSRYYAQNLILHVVARPSHVEDAFFEWGTVKHCVADEFEKQLKEDLNEMEIRS